MGNGYDYYVYAYYEEGRADPFYIGKGQGKRAWNHLQPLLLKRRDIFHNKLRKMIEDGFQPEISILMDGLTELESLEQEKYFIQKFGKICDSTGCLYNQTDGGVGGKTKSYPCSEELRKQRSEHMMGNTLARGRIRSQEEIDAFSKRRRAIACYRNGKLIKRYDYIRQVKEDGYSRSHIQDCLRGIIQTAYKMTWEYL